MNVLDKRNTTKLTNKISNQNKVPKEILKLSQKKRKDMNSKEKSKAFTTKTISESQAGKELYDSITVKARESLACMVSKHLIRHTAYDL